MKEAAFVLLVVLGLLAVTAVRYRKQIAGILGLARALKDVKDSISQSRVIGTEAKAGIPLVNCSTCGVWVPQNKGIRIRETYYCSEECLSSVVN